jgi:hypothetical protein
LIFQLLKLCNQILNLYIWSVLPSRVFISPYPGGFSRDLEKLAESLLEILNLVRFLNVDGSILDREGELWDFVILLGTWW